MSYFYGVTKRELLEAARDRLREAKVYKKENPEISAYLIEAAQDYISHYHYRVYHERLQRMVNAFPVSITFHGLQE